MPPPPPPQSPSPVPFPATATSDFGRSSSIGWAQRTNLSNARYRTDFTILSTLGSGGFGTTLEVRNSIDNKLYAMKVIRMRVGAEYAKVLREVEVLSSLQNENIVRYYNAWIEKADGLDFEQVAGEENIQNDYSVDGSMDRLREEFKNLEAARDVATSTDTFDTTNSDNDVAEFCVCNLCTTSYRDWEVSFEQWGLLDSVLQPLNLCVECYKKSLGSEQSDALTVKVRRAKRTGEANGEAKAPLRSATREQTKCVGKHCARRAVLPQHDCVVTLSFCCYPFFPSLSYPHFPLMQERVVLSDYLFIVMEFCDNTLLDQVDKLTSRLQICQLFSQCAEGLAHLHARGIIHRDIKPSNIFTLGGVAKIGDLGLATDRSQCVVGGEATGESKSTEVGTFLYTAPEIGSGQYSDACDVYSLGVVLIECFSNFRTGMERVTVLGGLRNGMELPSEWVREHGVVAEIAARMVQVDPLKRPSCTAVVGELLVHKLVEKPSYEQLERLVLLQHEQIKVLRAENNESWS